MLSRIREANKPGPPEHSLALRVAATGTVLIGIAACHAEAALSPEGAITGAALVIAGMVFSYRTRKAPPGYIKAVAAAAALSLLVWFIESLSGAQITDITAVENPLTILFVGIQAVHSFHVPSRRDLIFTVAGGAGLMALAAAQAIDLTFASYTFVWFLLTVWSLIELWKSASGGALVSTSSIAASVSAVCAAAVIVFLVLPSPRVGVRIGFIDRAGNGGTIPTLGALVGDSGSPSELSRPGTPAGRSRVGGYLGFANRLDTALRGNLGNALVMRVRAERPSYWIGETYDRWDGQSWLNTVPAKLTLRDGSPFYVPLPAGDVPAGQADLQTFYLATSMPDLIFHADSARQVWFPAQSLTYGEDGTLVSPIGLGRGAVYTVESGVNSPSPAVLRSDAFAGDSPHGNFTQLPHPYPEAQALAEFLAAGTPDTYDKVQSLIAWMGSHTRYSTNIPPLPAGADTVNEFLFRTRVGFCEQISTALAVMLRTLGIPAREAVGYVPDSYNPVTDLYEVRAKDAHSWVQVWFPGYGWQSFDPTASVPLANPSPGGTALKDLGHAFARIPLVPGAAGVGATGAAVLAIRWRRARPRTWDAIVLRQMELAGRSTGNPRLPAQTLIEHAAALERAARSPEGGPGESWSSLAAKVTRGTYGSTPSAEEQCCLVSEAHRLRKATGRSRRSVWAETGQGLIGLVMVLLVLGGVGAVVAVSVAGGSGSPLPSIPSLTTAPASSSQSNAPVGISEAEVATCNTDYAEADQALGMYETQNGRPPTSVSDLRPYLRDTPTGQGFTLTIQSGRIAVATPGYAASPGPANCTFAGQ